jgi:hypothetical protein
MTKSEFLNNCNFNTLPLPDAIEKVNELLNSDYNTIPGKDDGDLKLKCDKDGTPNENGKFIITNPELSAANEQLREQFPMLEVILRALRTNEFDFERTFQDLNNQFLKEISK